MQIFSNGGFVNSLNQLIVQLASCGWLCEWTSCMAHRKQLMLHYNISARASKETCHSTGNSNSPGNLKLYKVKTHPLSMWTTKTQCQIPLRLKRDVLPPIYWHRALVLHEITADLKTFPPLKLHSPLFTFLCGCVRVGREEWETAFNKDDDVCMSLHSHLLDGGKSKNAKLFNGSKNLTNGGCYVILSTGIFF